jgi:hypothetical protein
MARLGRPHHSIAARVPAEAPRLSGDLPVTNHDSAVTNHFFSATSHSSLATVLPATRHSLVLSEAEGPLTTGFPKLTGTQSHFFSLLSPTKQAIGARMKRDTFSPSRNTLSACRAEEPGATFTPVRPPRRPARLFSLATHHLPLATAFLIDNENE